MRTDPVQIAESRITDIQAQIRQKQQESAGKTGMSSAAGVHDVIEEDLPVTGDNELIYYSDLTEFKTYRFNGRINLGDNHLGTNFDITV